MLSELREQMQRNGFPALDLKTDGEIHRFKMPDEKNGKLSGWYVIKADGNSIGAAYGDHRKGEKHTWSNGSSTGYTSWSPPKAQSEPPRQEPPPPDLQKIWDEAKAYFVPYSPPDEHPYLKKKGVTSHGDLRVDDQSRLVIPVRNASNKLMGLQRIDESGSKRLVKGTEKKGHFYTLKGTTERVYIAEGYATAASIHEATGAQAYVAFDAGNLPPVAEAIRGLFPDKEIVIAADNDQWIKRTGQHVGFGKENAGYTKAHEAALAVNAKVIWPDFSADDPDRLTDFNDLHKTNDLDAVRERLSQAAAPGWPEPQPLTAQIDPKPYPVEQLPDGIREAVREVAHYTQAPVAMVATSALSVVSLVSQAHVDVQRGSRLEGPTSFFSLVIADSGERKSTVDGKFMDVVRQWELLKRKEMEPEIKQWQAQYDCWDAERKGLLEALKSAKKSKHEATDIQELKSELEQHELKKPEPPRVPRLIYADCTPEALAAGLAHGWPSGGIVSSEAGTVFGSHGMGQESIIRNLALLNQLWDETPIAVDRKGTTSFILEGVRLSVCLAIQEPALRTFLDKNGVLARGIGFLARFIFCRPVSTQGTRFYRETPDTWPCLSRFEQRVLEILDVEPDMDEWRLQPPMMKMEPCAKDLWIAFHNEVEKQLCPSGDYSGIRDVASKVADNAARLAALFQFFAKGATSIGPKAMEAAVALMRWYLHEALRFFGELSLPAQVADAVRLDEWIKDYLKENQVGFVNKRHTQQHGPLRSKDRLDTALVMLKEHDRIIERKEGRTINLEMNPAFL